MATWYALMEQTHNDMGWLHPVKRVRTIQKFDLPGTIKHERTAYKWATAPKKVSVLTCAQLYAKSIADDTGYLGTPFWKDQKCKSYHDGGHNVTGIPIVQIFPGWRVLQVSQDIAVLIRRIA